MFDHTDQLTQVLPSEADASVSYPPSAHVAWPLAQATVPTARPVTRVLIVDDQTIVRTGIALSLLTIPDMEVVGQCSSGEQAMRWCAEAEELPDVVLMDLRMPGMGGMAAIQSLHADFPQLHLIALTCFQEGGLVEEALLAGAIGYLLKDVEIEELAKAIRCAAGGMPILAPAASRELVQSIRRRPPPIGYDLTKRERQVLQLLAEGLSNQKIAEQLVITPATVKFHTRGINSKLGTSSRTETIVLALTNHLVATSASA